MPIKKLQSSVWLLSMLISTVACSQSQYPVNPVLPTSAEKRISFKDDSNAEILKNYPINNIGPTIMGGRVSDLEVDPSNPLHFYVAFASGGLWETKNNGLSFEPIFDKAPTLTIGDFDIHWATGTIYVGTGEVNSSRSSYAGLGIFKSIDNGKSWSNVGLPESHHIGRIIIDPANSDKVIVAVLGHLYSSNKERGIYVTENGGKDWKQTLFINENTGCVDLIIDSENKDVLYASAWERTRRAWNFWEAGNGSGIYKSTDQGMSWKLITSTSNGFPVGPNCGRIGLSMFHQGEKEVLYALVDNQNVDTAAKVSDGLKRQQFKSMSKGELINLDDSIFDQFLEENGFEKEYNAKRIKRMIASDSIVPMDIYNYLTDANTDLFESKLIGLQLFKSTDGGKSWRIAHDISLNKAAYTYGYYFGLVRVSPVNSDEVYIAGVPLLKSIDGGKNFVFAGGDNVHVDNHCLWINPANPNHLINGNDGGVAISYDKGKTWMRCQHPPVGQFYSVYADSRKNVQVYGGLQDNGVWRGPSNYSYSPEWQMSGKYPYQMLMGGDGMQVMTDDKEKITYTGYQFGHYYRIEESTGKQVSIQPKHELGESPLRFNWQSPVWLSVHNNDILYFGSNHVHRSMNKGDDWKKISPDLTKGALRGDVSFGTVTTIHESPLHFGWLMAGTDDGNVHLSTNGGESWQLISKNLPQNFWVSRVRFSTHDAQTIFVSLNGYRWDHFESMLYKSKDLGKTWNRISALPSEPVNTFTEDLKNKNLLYVGTDNGLYITFNNGLSFVSQPGKLPKVAIHDLFYHSAGKLFIGTHGRSLYSMDTKSLGELTLIADSTLYLFGLEDIIFDDSWGAHQFDFSYNIPQINGLFYTSVKATDSVQFVVETTEGKPLANWREQASFGYNTWHYNLQIAEENLLNAGLKDIEKSEDGHYYLPEGKYSLRLNYNGKSKSSLLIIKPLKLN